ncbi:OmpH family outer membrane protein [Litorimonas sp. RW-G-Af-16]|uniref:OmpH family outer membrane protein n=1 Tax=Litorimonas sp. RW-G-Af-16 TaxID=3241168 RepID=UPI00390C8CF3
MSFKLFRTVFFGAVLSLCFSAAAFAQSTILVVDTQRVLRDSEVGKHIARQLETISKSMDAEFKAKASPLESQAKSLEAQLKGKTAQDLQGNTALQQQIKNFQADQLKVREDGAYKQRELQITEAKAVQQVQTKLRDILKALVAERNADIVLERSLVIYGDPADVTDTVISRLNSQLRTVPVTRERLPRQ